MDSIFRPKVSATGQPSQPSNDDFMYRMIPRQLKKTPNTQMTRQAAMRVGSPVGSPQNNEWVDTVNSSSNEQLDQFFGKQTIPYYQNKFKANQQFRSSAPIAVSQGSSLRPNQESYRTGAAQTGGGVRQPSQGAGFQSLIPKVQSTALAQSAWPIQNQYVRNGLAASQGNYPTPENRRAGFFGRGFNLSVPQPKEERQLTFDPVQNAEANRALFAQHTNSMQNNPAYSQRVNAERAARRDQLADRDAIANARRQGAIEAAGSSQQLRNLMAGRGALGPGRDGFGALMSLAAMRNPNEAFGDFGQAFVGLNAPGMQTERLGAEGRMLDQNLGAQERMLGQNIGAQERMLGQELASRRTLADMNVAAQKAQAQAERAFMAAQNTTNFEQQKALTELGYKHQRESDQFGAMMQAIMQAGNPRDARQMIGMIRDPDAALDPNLNPGIDVPNFSPSEGSAGDRQAQLFELFDWAQRNGFDTNHPRFKSELIERQLNPTPEEMNSMVLA